MRAVALDNATHAHGRSTLKESARDNGVGTRDGVAAASDGQDTVVDTLDHLADAGLDTSFVAKISDVLASLANNDTGLLGRDNGAEGKLGLGVFLVRLRGRFAVGAEAVFELHVVHVIDDITAVGRHEVLRGSHGAGRVGSSGRMGKVVVMLRSVDRRS